jgi:YcxB-like protein
MQTGFSEQPGRPAPAAPGTEVEYVLDEEDYVECYRHVMARAAARAGQRHVWLHFIPAAVVTGLGAALLALVIHSICLHGIEENVPWVLPLFALWFLAGGTRWIWQTCRVLYSRGRAGRRRFVAQQLKAGIIHLDRRDRVILNPSGFVEFNEFDQSDGGVRVRGEQTTEVSWSAVERIDVVGDYLIVVVRAKGHLFVPRRAFADDHAFALFVETARRYHEEFPRRLPADDRAGAPVPVGDAITRRTDEHGPA